LTTIKVEENMKGKIKKKSQVNEGIFPDYEPIL
jgi:hypothetical protein